MRKRTKQYILVISFLSVVLVILYWIKPLQVRMSSMNPTLYDGDWVLVEKTQTKIKRGDIVVFKMNGQNYIKRCVGLPGDTVKSSEDILYINQQVSKGYSLGKTKPFSDPERINPNELLSFGHNWKKSNFGPYIIPSMGQHFQRDSNSELIYNSKAQANPFSAIVTETEIKFDQDYVFMAGDNRHVSSDSRNFGPVSINNIVGKVILVIYSHKPSGASHWFIKPGIL